MWCKRVSFQLLWALRRVVRSRVVRTTVLSIIAVRRRRAPGTGPAPAPAAEAEDPPRPDLKTMGLLCIICHDKMKDPVITKASNHRLHTPRSPACLTATKRTKRVP